MESFCAIIFTIILVLPFVLQFQMLIMNPKKLCSIFHYYASNGSGSSDQKVLQHFPDKPVPIDSSTDSKITVNNLRTIVSSPALRHEMSNEEDRKPSSILTATKHSSHFVKTDKVLPVVDITWNYNLYRYKAFEASLRDQYGYNYPPGKVVLNSMQLNFPDSKTRVTRNVSDGGLFDFVKESDVALSCGAVSRKLEIEYLNPLDHFVAKQPRKPSTKERSTETPAPVKEDNSEVEPLPHGIKIEENYSAIKKKPSTSVHEKYTRSKPQRTCIRKSEYLNIPRRSDSAK